MGLTGYYQKFVKDYGKIVAPLTQMLRKDSFNWSSKAELAFEILKEAISTMPALALPGFSKEFIIECDASGAGIGVVLTQGANHWLTLVNPWLKSA